MKNSFFKLMVKDEKGNYSVKRVLGIICVLVLNLSLLISIITKHEFTPSPELIIAIETIALGTLGLTSIDKFTLRSLNKNKSDSDEHSDNYNNSDVSQYYNQNQDKNDKN